MPVERRAARKGLGNILQRDPRDDAYPMTAVLAAGPRSAAIVPRERTWGPKGPVYDQGESSSCTGQSARALLDFGPVVNRAGPDAYAIYREAQRRDPWPGEEPAYYGSTVRAAMGYLKGAGYVGDYLWAQSYDELRLWILTRGPAVLGTAWTSGMYSVDWRGYARPRGEVVGGHAYLAYGVTRAGTLRCRNSWSENWGRNGDFFLSRSDFYALTRLRVWEACSPSEILVRAA